MDFLDIFLLAVLVVPTTAHPGDSHEALSDVDQMNRDAFFERSKRSLSQQCDTQGARQFTAQATASHRELVDSLRAGRDLDSDEFQLEARDSVSVIATNHNLSRFGATTPNPFTLGHQCFLVPEVTQGPYYVDGELFRSDIRESQQGVSLLINVLLIDVHTCLPVPNVFLEFWHCNSTGVYSGVVANGNGNENDATNINNTFLRGLVQTNAAGSASVQTLVPGHYSGRASHVHVMAHIGGSILANGTFHGGAITHVGQMFFDQNLLSQVATVAPYNTNTQPVVQNGDDMIFVQEAAGDSDPIVEYSMIGNTVAQGLVAFIAMGIDTTANYTVSSAASLTANGGVPNANGGGGGPGGFGGMPPGGMPPGGMPPGGMPPGGMPPGGMGGPGYGR